MKRLVQLLSAVTWLLVAGSIVIIAGGLFGRPLLLAAVPTGSMYPALNPGDLIVVLPPWTVPALGHGDIAVYRTERSPEWIVHRIVAGDAAEGYVLKGDANPLVDPHPVMPGEIAGVVPQWNGSALRLPRLGVLSMERGPLSSPAVAGIALVMGIYLLLMDVKPRLRLPHMGSGGRSRGLRTGASAVLSFYIGLAGAAFVSTLIPAWTMSQRQVVAYSVVEQRPMGVHPRNEYLRGQPFAETVVIRNPSPLPLLVSFQADDHQVTYSPPWALVPGHGATEFQATLDTSQAGMFSTVLKMGVFLPLMPPALLAWLARVSLPLTAVVTALIPALIVGGLAALDPRVRLVAERWRARLALHMFILF